MVIMYGTDFFASKPLATILKSSVTTSNFFASFFLVVNGTWCIYEATTYFSSAWPWQVAVHLKWGQRISKLRAKFFDAALYAVIYVGLTIPAKRGENLVNVSSELRVVTHLVEFFLHHTNLAMFFFTTQIWQC